MPAPKRTYATPFLSPIAAKLEQMIAIDCPLSSKTSSFVRFDADTRKNEGAHMDESDSLKSFSVKQVSEMTGIPQRTVR